MTDGRSVGVGSVGDGESEVNGTPVRGDIVPCVTLI